MDDFGPLESSDITRHLRKPRGFGVTGAHAPDGQRTIELTTDPSVHGEHGHVSVRCTEAAIPIGCGGDERAPTEKGADFFSAELKMPDRGFVRCRSGDAMRFWGRFAPEAELLVGTTGSVRLVARTVDGAVLAGPIAVSPDMPPTTLAW